MKILFAAPSFYDKEWLDLQRIKTGQAVMAGELSRNISSRWQKDIIVTGCRIHGKILPYGTLISTSNCELIKYVRFCDCIPILKNPLKMRQIIFEITLSRLMDKLLEKSKYDLICIHDFGPGNMELVKKCIVRGIKCIVTLHMYVGSDVGLKEKTYMLRRNREKFLLSETDIPITVVSSGMKCRILNDYRHFNPDRITVIPDGTDVLQYMSHSRKKDYTKDKMIFLCIGTIGKRKNQIQLLHSIDCLSETIRKRIYIQFIGTDTLDGKLQTEIKTGNYGDVASYIGSVPHEEIGKYYQNAYAVISTSLNEAFGLVFIEGFAYGIPSIFFNDIDAVEELYHPDAVELIQGKDNMDIALAMTNMIEKEWDPEKIKMHARTFDIRNIAKQYEQVYQTQIKHNPTRKK